MFYLSQPCLKSFFKPWIAIKNKEFKIEIESKLFLLWASNKNQTLTIVHLTIISEFVLAKVILIIDHRLQALYTPD